MSGAHVDPAALLSASGASRRAMLTHLRDCSDCRAAAYVADPSILFGLLALAPMPAPLLSELSSDVARHIGADRASLGVLAQGTSWSRRVAVAAVVTLTLLSGYATFYERPAAPPAIALSAIADVQPRADVDVSAGTGVSQVIDLTVGDTQIVMVYNGDLNL